jgi:hypothetical protein
MILCLPGKQPSLSWTITLSAFIIILLTRLSLWISRSTHDHVWYRGHESRKHLGYPDRAAVGALTSNVNAVSEELYAQRRRQNHHENRRAIYEIIGLTAAIIAAALAGYPAWIFKGQLEEAHLDKRPWIKTDRMSFQRAPHVR